MSNASGRAASVDEIIGAFFRDSARPMLIVHQATSEVVATNGAYTALNEPDQPDPVGQVLDFVSRDHVLRVVDVIEVDEQRYDVFVAGRPDGTTPDWQSRFEQTEVLTRLLIEETTDYAILLLDPTGHIISWNSGAKRIKGYDASDIIGQHFSIFYTEEDRESGHPQHELTIAARDGRYAEEGWRKRSNGERFWAAVVITALRDSAGRLSGFGKLTRDLTERKVAEEALSDMSARLTRLVEGSRDAFVLLESRAEGGRVRYANKSVERILGVTPQSLQLFSPDEGPLRPDSEIGQWLTELGTSDGEREFISEVDDHLRHLRARAVNLDEANPPQRALFIEDISDRRRTQEALSVTRERFEQLVSSLTDVYVIFDIATPCAVYASPSCLDVLGFPPEELLEDVFRLRRAVVLEDLPGVLRDWEIEKAAWAEGRASGLDVEFRIALPGGKQRWIRARYSPLRSGTGPPSQVSAVYEDISQRKESEDALRDAQQATALASAAKNEFLSRMSHELRTPMNAVLGFAQLLEGDDLAPPQAEAVAQILRSGEHLLTLINEVLDIARIESGDLHITTEPVPLLQLVHSSIELLGPLAARTRISLSVLPSADAWALADRQRLRQVLLNLLSNAVKYNVEGGAVAVRVEERDGRAWVAITDTGIGIATADLPRLFQPFDRLGNANSSVEGAGVGLSISKHLVEAMIGNLTVDSEPGRGTTFWVDLPPAEPPLAPAGRTEKVEDSDSGDHPQTTSLRLLYIEDNASNFRLVERIVENRPRWSIEGASSGRQGIESARTARPDLILLDLNLPDLSGLEVLLALRDSATSANVPVVVLTADATPTQVKRLRDEGVLDYLTKPLNVPALLSVLDSITGGTHERP